MIMMFAQNVSKKGFEYIMIYVKSKYMKMYVKISMMKTSLKCAGQGFC